MAFQSEMCGNAFGVEGGTTQALVCKYKNNENKEPNNLISHGVAKQTPFILGLHTGTTDFSPVQAHGFNLDYTQVKIFFNGLNFKVFCLACLLKNRFFIFWKHK